MDIVLIPRHTGAAQNLQFFSPRGLSQLVHLASWLASQGSPSDQYVVVPRGQPDLIPLLAEFAQVLHSAGKLNFILAIEDVSLEAMETVAASGVSELVICADETRAFDVMAQAALGQFLRRGFAKTCSIQLWLPDTRDGRELERSLSFLECGLGPNAIREPRFPLDDSLEMRLLRKPPPRELSDAAPACQFFSNSLTINASAGIQACARHAPDERLGSFLEESPEVLIYRKGYSSRLLQGSPICRSCFYSGRFHWPKPKTEAIEALLQTGMDAGPEFAEEA